MMNLLDKVNLLLNAKLNELIEGSVAKESGMAEKLPPTAAKLEQTLQELEALKRELAQQLGQQPPPTTAEISRGDELTNQLEATLTTLEQKLADLKAEANRRSQAAESSLKPPQVTVKKEPLEREDEPELAARKSRLAG